MYDVIQKTIFSLYLKYVQPFEAKMITFSWGFQSLLVQHINNCSLKNDGLVNTHLWLHFSKYHMRWYIPVDCEKIRI